MRATPLPLYYGCTAAGACTAENVALAAQVTNPVAMFAADNNGIIVRLPNLQNANGDAVGPRRVDVRASPRKPTTRCPPPVSRCWARTRTAILPRPTMAARR